jgi:purine-binding chemotaxis protein CheW
MNQLVSFRVGKQLFGIEILLVREIDTCLECTAVQLAPSYIVGLANLRGQIVTLFDLGERLGIAHRPSTGPTHDIMLRSTTDLALVRTRVHRDDLFTCADPVGLRVDGIGDIVEVTDGSIDGVPANVTGVERRFLRGVSLLSDELLLVLDLRQLLEAR